MVLNLEKYDILDVNFVILMKKLCNNITWLTKCCDEIKRENGEQYGKYRGFCCETHRYPNGPNIKHSPNSITKVGEEYNSTTVFKFNF